MDSLIKYIYGKFGEIKDNRRGNKSYKLQDVLQAGYSIFALKHESLFSFGNSFENRLKNLKEVYHVEQIPSSNALRNCLDSVSYEELQPILGQTISDNLPKTTIERYFVLGDYIAISADGTGIFSSTNKKCQCEHCLVKNAGTPKENYYHQFMGSCVVSPYFKEVFPIACEPIMKQDGSNKNDCESNANKRLLPQIRRAMGEQKIIMLYDALYVNGPQIEQLKSEQLNMRFIINLKDKSVSGQVAQLTKQAKMRQKTWKENGKTFIVRYAYNLSLNPSNSHIKVNYFESQVIDHKSNKKTYYGRWVTDLPISSNKIQEYVMVARSRWKIENETFNTLKNQGYNLEHNYGHGKKYLSTNFAILTFIAFLIDQISQATDLVFQKAMKSCKTKKLFWYRIRQLFEIFSVQSMSAIYKVISKDTKIPYHRLI